VPESVALLQQQQNAAQAKLLARRATDREYQRTFRVRRKAKEQLQLQLENKLPEVDILPFVANIAVFNANEDCADDCVVEEGKGL